MNLIVVSVIGHDCPGVVYAIAGALAREKCNIIELSQTILKGQFASIFIVSAPESISAEDVQRVVGIALDEKGMDLSVSARPFADTDSSEPAEETEPFAVIVNGVDQPEVMSVISGIFAEQHVNIENLKAISVAPGTNECVLVFEVALPVSINRSAFRQMLEAKARALNLSISMQHQAIFEAIHRVPIV